MEQVTQPEPEPKPAAYQVFINHRGPDTKKNLASLIYHRLVNCGLLVFLDKEELRTGDTLCPAIRKAICTASVHIAIFSEHYAESSWCLNELSWILRSSHERTIIPVFCDVEPIDLRYVYKGRYAQAFDKHEQNGRVSVEVVEGWNRALIEAADISGLPFKTNESDHGEFLEDIVKIVLKEVKWEPLEVATYPVGLDQSLEDLENAIQNQRATKVVGIAGIGGVGKSTLAKHFFNLRRSKFNRSCYLSNVRDANYPSLQQQLFRDLLGIYAFPTYHEYNKRILLNNIKGLKILIVLDDADGVEQVKSLLDMLVLEHGSLIVITCRDKYIARGSFANALLYDVKPLKKKHAQELFCRHAFLQSKPFEEYEDLVEEFLTICGGLPLCLKVLGEKVAGNLDRTYWKRQLDRFSQGLPLREADTVINTLKLSYQAMDNEEKELFLDIGCFFVEEDQELTVRVLEGLGYNDVSDCLESLHQKCLVDFDTRVESAAQFERASSTESPRPEVNLTRCTTHRSLMTYRQRQDYMRITQKPWQWNLLSTVLPQRNRKIIMQNQVRELARHIVREELRSMDKPLRLACAIDIVNLMQLQGGSHYCRIRGIRISKGQNLPQLTNNISIQGLRFLVVEHPIDWRVFGPRISGDLVWLRLQNCHFISLPSAISLRSLRVLELQGGTNFLENFFNSVDEIPPHLRELNIDATEEAASASTSSSSKPVDQLQQWTKSSDRNMSTTQQLAAMPYFSRFLQWIGSLMKNLNKMVLKNVTVLQSLPIDCRELKNLKHLDLSGSTNLTTLPNSFSQLLQLQHLALRNCINLSIPTDILGEISTLEHIDFKGCARLVHLPQGIASQRRLRYLNLLHTGLLELPLNLGPLDELEQLRIGSASLTELPHSVAYFVHLKELILVECLNLKQISTPIENLTYLERLEIYGSKLPILPSGIARLKHMKVLTIFGCPIESFSFCNQVNSVDNNTMDALRDFTLTDTSICTIFIPASICPGLEIVDLSCNSQLMQVQGFPSTVVRLNLEFCSKLESLANLSGLVHLKFLNINGCVELETLNVEGLASLEEITAEKCWKLQKIEALCQLQKLNCFRISTYNGVLWKDIFQVLTSRSQITAISGAIPDNTMVQDFEQVIRLNLSSFKHYSVEHVPAATTAGFPVLLRNAQSQGIIFICFIIHGSSNSAFRVCLKPNDNSAAEVYQTVSGDGSGGRRVHMYMWTEDSKLFKDEKFSGVVEVFNYRGTKLHRADSDNGWIVALPKN